MDSTSNTFQIADPTRYEGDIRAFEAGDEKTPPAQNPIVFVGSSSIRLWEHLIEDFAPLPVINRGFGGSYISDSVYYADRIVTNYAPKAVVVYAGENDIGNGASGEHVFEQFKLLVEKIHQTHPEAEVFFLSIKPSPGRGAANEQIRVTNKLVSAWVSTVSNVTYIDIATPMLGENNLGRDEFFVEDGVHMKRNGYELWRDVVAPFLAKFGS